MKISTVSSNGVETGEHIIIADKVECQTILKAFEAFVKGDGKRNKTARRMARRMENDLNCF